MRIIETDNFGSDYPEESFVLGERVLSEPAAKKIAAILNEYLSGDRARRYFMVVDDNYKLAPKFEP